VEREDAIALLRLLGDSDAESHWNLFAAARVLMIVGMALLGAAAIVALVQGCVPVCPSRACILLPFLLTAAAIACSVLVPIFWGVLQRRAFDSVSWFDSGLGYSWILSVIAPGLALLALVCMMAACVTGWRGKGAHRDGRRRRCCLCFPVAGTAAVAAATTTTTTTTATTIGAPALLQPASTAVMVAPAGRSTTAYAVDKYPPPGLNAGTTATTDTIAGSSAAVPSASAHPAHQGVVMT
jgi:hypothetical protein